MATAGRGRDRGTQAPSDSEARGRKAAQKGQEKGSVFPLLSRTEAY